MIAHDLTLLTDDNLHMLPPRDQTILRLRYGLDGPPKSMSEIAAVFGVSPQTIRLVEKRAWLRLGHLHAADASGTAAGNPTPQA